MDGGESCTCCPQGTTVYDKDTDSVRELRYCPNENSIWADEQGPKAQQSESLERVEFL